MGRAIVSLIGHKPKAHIRRGVSSKDYSGRGVSPPSRFSRDIGVNKTDEDYKWAGHSIILMLYPTIFVGIVAPIVIFRRTVFRVAILIISETRIAHQNNLGSKP